MYGYFYANVRRKKPRFKKYLTQQIIHNWPILLEESKHNLIWKKSTIYFLLEMDNSECITYSSVMYIGRRSKSGFCSYNQLN